MADRHLQGEGAAGSHEAGLKGTQGAAAPYQPHGFPHQETTAAPNSVS